MPNTKELVCRLTVKASGWVGLGFSDVNYWMRNMDVMMAGVREGKGYIGVRKPFLNSKNRKHSGLAWVH